MLKIHLFCETAHSDFFPANWDPVDLPYLPKWRLQTSDSTGSDNLAHQEGRGKYSSPRAVIGVPLIPLGFHGAAEGIKMRVEFTDEALVTSGKLKSAVKLYCAEKSINNPDKCIKSVLANIPVLFIHTFPLIFISYPMLGWFNSIIFSLNSTFCIVSTVFCIVLLSLACVHVFWPTFMTPLQSKSAAAAIKCT